MMVEKSAAPMINGKSVTSLATTVAVNCRPVEAPATTVPAGRPHGMSRTGAPANDSAMVANSGPSSHGNGRCTKRAKKPPATPPASVKAIASAAPRPFGMRSRTVIPCMGDGRGNSRARANPSSLARGTHAHAFDRAGNREVAQPPPTAMLATPPRHGVAMSLISLQRLGSMFAGIFLCATLVHAALPTPADKPDRGSLTGQLLIASPSMGDPRFSQTVVLMVRHDHNGAFGIVINRPLGDRPLASLLAALGEKDPAAAGTVRIFAGGPVEPDIGFVVHSTDYRRPDTVDIDANLALTSSREILRDIGNQRGPAKSLIAFGYAGWAAGQLEGELAQNFWFTTPQDGSLVFDDDRDEVWDHAMKRRTQDL